jgi:polysaccharide export outer membrane protein
MTCEPDAPGPSQSVPFEMTTSSLLRARALAIVGLSRSLCSVTALVLILSCAFVLAEGVEAQSPAPASPITERRTLQASATVPSTYVLGPYDEVLIQAGDVPELSGKPQRVDPDGDLRLPMIGRVRAAGMTLEQLEADLKNRLKVFIHEPDIVVSVIEFRSQPVSVIGAVSKSGVHQLEGHKTLIEMLSLVGGLSPDAGPIVQITRDRQWGRLPLGDGVIDAADGSTVAAVAVKPLLAGQTPDKNINIRPHDVISVPRAELVYVVGEVAKAGPLPLVAGPSLSVMEALSSSGGVLRSAAGSHARILRSTASGQKRTELAVDIVRIMQAKDDDVPLFAGDILVVPDSKSKRAVTRAVEAAIQTGLMIASYGIVR